MGSLRSLLLPVPFRYPIISLPEHVSIGGERLRYVLPMNYNVADKKVITQWQYYRGVMSQGNSSLFQVLAGYVCIGLIGTFIRLYFQRHRRLDKWLPREKRRFYIAAYHLNMITAILVVGAILFLFKNPWRTMRSTLLFDTLSIFNFRKAYVPSQSVPAAGISSPRYSPSKDPYYVSNLDEPVDPFIASALEGTEFKNIVHIMLESMRSDSFPWDEKGLLHQHLQEFMEPPQIPLTVENITPFIESIASHTLRWDTMWSTIPYTLKAMLGRTFPFQRAVSDGEIFVEWFLFQVTFSWRTSKQDNSTNNVYHKYFDISVQ